MKITGVTFLWHIDNNEEQDPIVVNLGDTDGEGRPPVVEIDAGWIEDRSAMVGGIVYTHSDGSKTTARVPHLQSIHYEED
jgi:hypothetical protein